MPSARLNQNITPTTHHCLLNIDFLTTGQTEICYLSHKIVPNKNIPRCQIPVDELGPREQRRGGKRCHDKDTDTTILSKIKNEPVNKSEKKKYLVLVTTSCKTETLIRSKIICSEIKKHHHQQAQNSS